MPPTRQPQPEKPSSPQSSRLTVLGVDPGLASLGLAVLRRDPSLRSMPEALLLESLGTKKGSKKLLRNIRVADDDERRYREIWERVGEVIQDYGVTVVAMENYVPYAQVGSGAWKTCRVCGLIHGLTLSRKLTFLSFLPQDLKRRIAGKLSASKEEVEAALHGKVWNFQNRMQTVRKDDHEHLADATGHAYLAFAEMDQLRQLMGGGSP